MAKKILESIKPRKGIKYPSAEFLHSVSLEDYNRVLANYDKIYDRINIALAVCSAILISILGSLDITLINKWSQCTICTWRVMVAIYYFMAVSSAVLIVIAVIKLLRLSISKEIMVFDSNSIKDEMLYEETTEDAALWIILQYTRVINNLRIKINEKQEIFRMSTILVIVALLAYFVSIIMKYGVAL